MTEESISGFGSVTPGVIVKTAKKVRTPAYLIDEGVVSDKCDILLSMPNAYGLTVLYSMKANSTRRILQSVDKKGLHFDASSLNEARRLVLVGVPYGKIMLTSQEVHNRSGRDKKDLENMMMHGLKYNVCSLRQFNSIANFAAINKINLSMRVHPGVGSGESSTRNTGDKYSCFGVHLSDIKDILKIAEEKTVVFDKVHVHIGSGGDQKKWEENIDRELAILKEYFPLADTINFGGGLKEARMPNETAADIKKLGLYAKKRIIEFRENDVYKRELTMEIEPGTYVVANAGYIITRVIDKKRTGEDGFNFIITDGGMEVNTRPLLYGSQHPLYVVTREGKQLKKNTGEFVVVGRCCESGDSQTLDEHGHIMPRKMPEPSIGDYVVMGGAGAYCLSMCLSNYNSHVQAPEVLLNKNGRLELMRKEQTLTQVVQNEI